MTTSERDSYAAQYYEVVDELADLTQRYESLEHVALEVMAERDRAVRELERLSQLSLTGEPA